MAEAYAQFSPVLRFSHARAEARTRTLLSEQIDGLATALGEPALI